MFLARLCVWLVLAGGLAACVSASQAARRDREAAFEKVRLLREEQQEEGAEIPRQRRRGPPDPDEPALESLANAVQATGGDIEFPGRLRRFFEHLDRLDERLLSLEGLDLEIARLESLIRKGQDRDANTVQMQNLFRERATLEAGAPDDVVRVLHLGDSHIAADYITRTARARLQARFGDGGRGFVSADQKSRFGGRRLSRAGWNRVRAVDTLGRRKRSPPTTRRAPRDDFGLAGIRLESARAGAEAVYGIASTERLVVFHYRAHPKGPELRVEADGIELERWSTDDPYTETRVRRVDVDLPPPKPEQLTVTALGAGAELFGLSFETNAAGLLYDAIGPVGADAAVWTSMDPFSFAEHAQALSPSLVVLMIGGNDALALRQGRRTPKEVRSQLQALVRRLTASVPEADCLVFGPLDAAQNENSGRYKSRRYIETVVEIERKVAKEEGCAFWDAYRAMGGEGSFGRWLDRGLMNEDLVHPRSRGADLLGHLFARALASAYLSVP